MWLSKRALLGGILGGFLACCGLGRHFSRQPMLEHFQRFIGPIQPQQYFYPTASELVSYLEHRIERGKNLALVGGASYFRGTGQNPGELWTLELQRRLADRYTVVNFAIDQAGFTSFAAVPFQIMAARHPGMIYIANASPISGEERDGIDEYKYIFWDAYYKGLFPATVAQSGSVQAVRRAELKTAEGRELHLGKWIDGWTYSCDLWTYVGYKWLFTVWSDDRAGSPFKPRREYGESDDPHLQEHRLSNQGSPEFARRAERGNLDWARDGYRLAADGHWRPDPGAWGPRVDNWRTLFPPELKKRIFLVLLRANPFYTRTLTPEDRANVELTYAVGKSAFEKEGYNVVRFKAGDFQPEDFVDSGHLLASGGRIVAAATAARIAEFEGLAEANLRWNRSHAGALALTLTVAPGADPAPVPLFAIRRGEDVDERVVWQRQGNGRIRFGYDRGGDDSPVFSEAVAVRMGEPLQAVFSLSGLYPPSLLTQKYKRWTAVELNGQPVWTFPVEAEDQPLGLIELEANLPVSETHRGSWPPVLNLRRRFAGGVVRLAATAEAMGRSLPLVATGRNGAGDLLFARWSDDGALSFGFDHWSDATRFSPAVRVAPGSVHAVEFRSAGLTGESKGEVAITLDGRPFWRFETGFHPAAPQEIYWGRNPIEATTAESRLVDGKFERLLPAEDAAVSKALK